MNGVNFQHLTKVLRAVGKAVESYESPDGSRVLLLPYGGRVLGVFAREDDENFYWTHHSLGSVESARAFYASGEWQNSGGDRTWLAPEVDFFFPSYPNVDLSTYWQPRELDPGDYRLETRDGTPELVNRMAARLSRSKKTVELEIRKSVGPAANPLRYEPELRDAAVAYAGYAQWTSLEITGGDPAPVGLWNLIQMPHGGDLLAPTFSRTQPRIYFGSIPPEDLIVSDHLVRYRMRSAGEHKIGIRALATTGRVGYLYSGGSRASLVIRNFAVNPSGEYVDVPWAETNDLGYSTQACNVSSHLGQFSELEYHVPAIGPGTGRTRCEDVSQIWCFRGEHEAIHKVAGALLTDAM
jgi:hypothetical protein